MSKLLLFGGSGFIGQHINKYYRDNNWDVICAGRSKNSDINVDLADANSIISLDLPNNITRVVHAAAINEALISKSLKLTYDVNVTATRLLAELAIKHEIPEFVYISTFHVYGKDWGGVDLNTPPKPLNDYGLTHYLSEEILKKFLIERGVKLLCIRPTNVFGLPIDFNHFDRWSLIPYAFPREAVIYKKVTLKSSGLQYRNFVNVVDVAKATCFLNHHNTLNVYGKWTLTVRNFAEKVATIASQILNKDVSVKYPENIVEHSSDMLAVNNGTFNLLSTGSLDRFLNDIILMLLENGIE